MINPHIDSALDHLKNTYNGMESLLSKVAINIAFTLPDDIIHDINVVYFPQLGFNITLPLNQIGQPIYDGRDEGWEQTFTTENRAYFKDYRMREMDDNLGDIYGLICGKRLSS